MTLEDERAIARVLALYCRGIDRRDFELVRSCYHPDATDDHGPYRGDVEGFLAYTREQLARFTATTHFLGNVLVDIDPSHAETAVSEAYTLAFHRLPGSASKPERDYIVGLRYLDTFERRGGRWAIARRRCALDWHRIDPVGAVPAFPPGSLLGAAGPSDPLFH